MSEDKKYPPLTESERVACLELSNRLLGLNYAVIDTFRTLDKGKKEQFVERFEKALIMLSQEMNLRCPCGECGRGVCCVCN